MTAHDCPGCDTAGVPDAQFACPTCWHALPPELRRSITTTHRARDRDAHGDAMAEALEWYAAKRAADAARPVGTRQTTPGGTTMQWTGRAWRMVTRAELDREAR